MNSRIIIVKQIKVRAKEIPEKLNPNPMVILQFLIFRVFNFSLNGSFCRFYFVFLFFSFKYLLSCMPWWGLASFKLFILVYNCLFVVHYIPIDWIEIKMNKTNWRRHEKFQKSTMINELTIFHVGTKWINSEKSEKSMKQELLYRLHF